jgi:sugar phosphate isomerase/epimerase
MDRMRYGAMNFPIKPVLDELETISRLGFDYLELTMDAPQAHYTTIRRIRDDLLRTLGRLHMGLMCHLPTFVSTADLTEGLREASLNEVLESLEVAAELRPMKVVLHPSPIRGLAVHVKDQARRYALKSLEVIVKKADQLGLCICLENMFPQSNSLVNPEDFVEIFERFPHLKMTLDTGHTHIGSKGSRKILDFIERFPDRIFHVHASDNLGKEDDHLPIGAGTIDFPEIVKALKNMGYNETVTLEVFSRDRDYLRLSREKFTRMMASL